MATKKRLLFFLNSLESYIKDNNYKSSDLAILEIGCSNGSLVTLPIAEEGYNILGIELIEITNDFDQINIQSFIEGVYIIKITTKTSKILISQIIKN